MSYNVPDDWGAYYYRCTRCGDTYHASEGGCGACAELDRCERCEEEPYTDSLHQADSLTELPAGDRSTPALLCAKHAKACDCCDGPGRGPLRWCEEGGLVLCAACWEDEHACPASAA